MRGITSFIVRKWPYFIGFAIIEGGIYYFNGATGNFTTGFAGLFCIWLYYVWSYRADYSEERFAEGKRNDPVDHFERRTP